MRVLLTADAVGGVWTYALDLARGLRARGEAVVLAVLGPAPSPAQRAQAASLSGLELVETGLPLDWTAEAPDALAAAARGLAELAAARRVDLLHLNSPALAGFARFPAPVVGVAHSDLLTWWAAVKGGEPPPDFRWRIEAAARGYRACDLVLAPSAAFAADTARAYGVQPRVVHNGRAPPAPAAERPRDLPVLTAGRLWDEGKGADVLDAAAERLAGPVVALGPRRGPQGQGPSLPHLDAPGAVSAGELADALRRARVFCSPSRYEPFGLAVLEAAQAGCALVLSDIATFRELWGGAAAFAAPGDALALAAVLTRVLSDDAERAELAAAVGERAARYGRDAFVEGTAEAYRSVLQASRPVRAPAEAAA